MLPTSIMSGKYEEMKDTIGVADPNPDAHSESDPDLTLCFFADLDLAFFL